MLVVAMLLLCLGASLGVPGLVAYIMLYGAASGLVIVVRTTSTLEYLGGYGFGTAAGALAVVTLLPRTGAPTVIAALWEVIGRSEERRAGKGCVSTCRSRWSPAPSK